MTCIHARIMYFFIWLLSTCFGLAYGASPLTFELEDRASRCFYKVLTFGTEYHLDYEVLDGGNFDVDVVLFNSQGTIHKLSKRQSHGTIHINGTGDGEYRVCFGNKFSSFAHKVVYFSWYNNTEMSFYFDHQSGPQDVFAQSTETVSYNLQKIAKIQVRERMLQTISMSFATGLNSRVQNWSIGQSVLIIAVGIGQVFVLRSLFSVPTKRHSFT